MACVSLQAIHARLCPPSQLARGGGSKTPSAPCPMQRLAPLLSWWSSQSLHSGPVEGRLDVTTATLGCQACQWPGGCPHAQAPGTCACRAAAAAGPRAVRHPGHGRSQMLAVHCAGLDAVSRCSCDSAGQRAGAQGSRHFCQGLGLCRRGATPRWATVQPPDSAPRTPTS